MNRRIMKGMLIVTASMVFSVSSISVSAIEAGKKAELFAGDYTGGVDIPAGTYILKYETNESTNGIVWLSSETDDLEEDYPSLLYEHVATGENKEFFISLHEGGILHVPFKSTLTAVDYMENDITELHTGTYVCGKDLPEGKYLVSYESDSSSNGIIWLADVGDNLEEDYPSMLYEHISNDETGNFYISMIEGRILYLPVSCNTVTVMESIEFEDSPVDLYAGQYLVGDDIPAGIYEITCLPEEFRNSGLLWISSPTDNLEDDYPSVLYEHVNSEEAFRVTVEEGGKIQLPFHCRFAKTSGGVVFN